MAFRVHLHDGPFKGFHLLSSADETIVFYSPLKEVVVSFDVISPEMSDEMEVKRVVYRFVGRMRHDTRVRCYELEQ